MINDPRYLTMIPVAKEIMTLAEDKLGDEQAIFRCFIYCVAMNLRRRPNLSRAQHLASALVCGEAIAIGVLLQEVAES